MPPAIKNAPLDVCASYLRGFFDSEGCVEVNERRVKGTSSHLPGLEDISALLRTFGIRFKILRQSKQKSAYDIRIQDRKSVELFAKHMGFTVMRRAKRLRQVLISYKRRCLEPPKLE